MLKVSGTLIRRDSDGGEASKMNTRYDLQTPGFPNKEMFAFPNIVNVEVFRGRCPCKCRHCPVGITPPTERKDRFGEKGMDMIIYQKIVTEMARYPHTTLRIHSVGDPLLWDNLIPALQLSRQNSERTWIFISGVTENKSLLADVCRNASIVEVSVNSTTKEEYRLTKGIDAFSLVKENIRYMHGLKNDQMPFRLIASRVQSTDKRADEQFVHHWKSTGLVDDSFVRTYHTYNDLLDTIPENPRREKHQPCLVFWARFNISVDGYAVVCFNELFNKELSPALILGDLRNETIAQIWHGSKLNKLRKAELVCDYANIPFRDVLPCKECSSCQPLNGNNQTSEYQVRQLSRNPTSD
jgi:MoaA/NifB/PqqE/SkfB family radical SAM enzyme